ncbi:MAG TPA: cytochrome P450 [Caulobacteraceae bacterium]|jgi:cytochrome P450|nr:cytochrome P450 [Caulobacteraceae bacterium]
MAKIATPSFQGDLYGHRALADPYPAYRRLRDLGPAVWMPRRQLWAVGRFDDVRSVLRNDTVFISGRGVAANEAVNRADNPITLTSDTEAHDRRRGVLIQPVMPGPLKDLRPRLEREAEQLVAGLSSSGETFDAMARFASHLPVTVVGELVGLNEAGRQNMLRWAAATFNVLGVLNARGLAAMPSVIELGRYIRGLSRDTVAPGGWAARLFDAAERGELSAQEAQAMVIDYVGPALDTTILATGHMLWLLATTPGAYDAVRSEPGLIPGVVNEAVRLASPIRSFTRYAAEAHQLGETVIPQGARVLVLFASANRDERHYPDPDAFDVRRNPRDHVAWGHGPHTCVGMHLARLEMEVLLASLVAQVERFEVGRPTRARNNVLQGFKALPARFHPVRKAAAA